MKQKIFLPAIIIFLSLCTGSYAQKYPLEFGKISNEELSMTKYPADTEAEALVLYDKGLSKFIYGVNGFEIHFTRNKRIKILKSAGKQYAEIAIPYYREGDIYEKITDLEAYTYNLENGQITRTPVDPSNVFDTKENERWNLKKFAFPNVKEGSVIEYHYTLITPYIFRLPDWEFQDDIPTLYSEYVVHMVPFYQYTWLLQGATKFNIYKNVEAQGLENNVAGVSYHDMISTYGMLNVPAFKEEEFLTCRDDYLIKLTFQRSSFTDQYGATSKVANTWESLIKNLSSNTYFGKYVNAAGRISKKLVDYDTLNNLLPEEKFDKIVDFVKNNFRWDGNRWFYASKSAGKFADEKTGNCADINLFLCGMLQEADLDATPVILSTRDHGLIKYNYPFIDFFNYAIVLVNFGDKKVLADATDPISSNELIPAQCLNDKGLVASKGDVSWVKLTSGRQSQTTDIFVITPEAQSDSLKVFFSIKADNYDGLNLRKMYVGKESNLEDYFHDKNIHAFDSVKVKYYDDPEKSFTLAVHGNYPSQTINGKIYISPFLDEPASSNPFKYKTRTYPIDMSYPRTKIFTSQISIPRGYKVESTPENRNVQGTLVEIYYTVKKLDNKLLVTGMYKFNQAVYPADDYSKLKAYYDIIINKFNEKIVLAPVE